MSVIHEREQEDADIERYTKRAKLDNEVASVDFTESSSPPVLPPSHSLLGLPVPIIKEGQPVNFHEPDVGISEYIGRGDARIEGIIKQRFTDFLVFEVDLDGKVIHLKSIGKPASSGNDSTEISAPDAPEQEGAMDILPESISGKDASRQPNDGKSHQIPDVLGWQDHFTTALEPFLDKERIQQVKDMYLQGGNPPRVSDSGWASRNARSSAEKSSFAEPTTTASEAEQSNKRKSKNQKFGLEGVDDRKVVSEPMTSKETRTAFHKVIRELFAGKLDTETDSSTPEGGARITVKWAHQGQRSRGQGRSGRRNDTGGRSGRGSYPPYIHFTMQKTNRDTQDAIGQLSRLLHVSIKDLSVAGTKDKRGVTVQRVSLLRNQKTIEDVWRLANNIGPRRTLRDAISQRGERGIRIADLNYRKASLELGMLKGNAFVITLRNVKVSSKETLDETMNTLKTKGFINYYGMQRFGTASVPTHAIGLALLRSEWQTVADLILQKRFGEHPDVEAARDAWLNDRNLDLALSLFPRRVVAERCILESFKKQKGDTRNVMGAISTIPKNLRLMYIHAYQSYVWNAIVSERLRVYGSDLPVVGDLVFEKDDDTKMSTEAEEESITLADDTTENVGPSSRRSRKAFVAPRVRTLTKDDVHKYTIFDVIMPLPGTDVAYPGGALGEKYRQYLRMDGLDPDNWVRKQREYTLSGSYRKILHLPQQISWALLSYTDPDVPLAQADEDKLLGFDPPGGIEDGKFMALQIHLVLGTAVYATMALREITKMDTSSHVQSSLTVNAEDQLYRGGLVDEAETMEDAH